MRNDLPTGTVTFLFTDVEGSTKLLHELGAEMYAEALAEHRRLIREACASHDGVEVDTQGDAFFFAFPTAPAALAASSELTRALSVGPIQVRVGLHTGTPLLTEEGYVGGDVHRAARIADSGHGGQVLVSASTAALVDLELLDLGEHRLKDLSAPERIYQLGDSEFPPLKTLYQTNLPVPASPFLGRERELAEVTELLSQEDVRLLTLTGPGGTGKTRLALHAAAEAADKYEHGVWWVPLASLLDPAIVLEQAAKTLGAKANLPAHIADKRLLLLFDSFEHVVDAGPAVADLTSACPNLDIFVTSREPLHVTGEQEYPVPPLVETEAVELFHARARAAVPGFSANGAVVEICRRLDCLPLAVELAAGRVKALSSRQILERLEQRLPLLTGGARDLPERQRTLRATIEWSYDLLSEDEQRLFARLSVFAGGCTLEAAEEVAEADLDTLQSLVEKSLIRYTDERFWMLETIREYADARLDEGEKDVLLERLARCLLRLAEAEGAPMFFDRQTYAFPRLEPEHPNTRAVVTWALERGRSDLIAELFASLGEVWACQNRYGEAIGWIDGVLASRSEVPAELFVEALSSAAELVELSGDDARAGALHDQALALAASTDGVDPFWEAAILVQVSRIALDKGDTAHADALARRSLELRITKGLPRARALAMLGEIALREGDLDRATSLLEEALSVVEGRHALNDARYVEALAEVARRRGDTSVSKSLFASALRTYEQLDHRVGVADCLEGLAVVAEAEGDAERAARLWGAGVAMRADARRSRPERVLESPDAAQPMTPEDAMAVALAEID